MQSAHTTPRYSWEGALLVTLRKLVFVLLTCLAAFGFEDDHLDMLFQSEQCVHDAAEMNGISHGCHLRTRIRASVLAISCTDHSLYYTLFAPLRQFLPVAETPRNVASQIGAGIQLQC